MSGVRTPRLIAFYLPQFHPIPENDRWWGNGFTEWTNVTRTVPRFRGHETPHVPAELGYYDLRSPQVREAQADLARGHGIFGFCYYHYWFGGRRLLERPFDEVLASGRPDLPFCLCWANESWTRRWDGGEHDVLLAQTYGEDDDLRHIESLIPALRDPRYIRVHGRPLLLIYRASRLPNPRKTVETWRRAARQGGVGDLHLCNVESFDTERGLVPRAGFDAAVEFAPDWSCLRKPARRRRLRRVAARLGLSSRAFLDDIVCDYDAFAAAMLEKPPASYPRYPCVTPSWDNSARRRTDAVILRDASPASYERWLGEVLRRSVPSSAEEDIVFVNAWNEWAEGCHLEPCRRWGRGYLEATQRALADLGPGTERGPRAALA
jgi:hypothetical protein